MENNTFKFKTTINCSGCVKAVTPFLNQVEGIEKWNVDTNVDDKILTVQSDKDNESDIVEAVKKAGFEIQAKP